MKAIDISRHIVRSSGLSDHVAAKKAGRSVNGFNPYIYRQNMPTLPVLAELCNVCDFDLLVRNRKTGEETIIDPPEK